MHKKKLLIDVDADTIWLIATHIFCGQVKKHNKNNSHINYMFCSCRANIFIFYFVMLIEIKNKK